MLMIVSLGAQYAAICRASGNGILAIVIEFPHRAPRFLEPMRLNKSIMSGVIATSPSQPFAENKPGLLCGQDLAHEPPCAGSLACVCARP